MTTDSVAAKSYLWRGGYGRFRRLGRQMQWFREWILREKVKGWEPAWIAGKAMPADGASQIVDYGDWALSDRAISRLSNQFGDAQVDLFASHRTAVCDRYLSRWFETDAMGYNALNWDWTMLSKEYGLLWATPPTPLLDVVVSRLRAVRSDIDMLVITPAWRSAPWFVALEDLADEVWEVPGRNAKLLYGNVEGWAPNGALTAFRCRPFGRRA